MENIDKIYDLLNDITVTKENESMVREIKDLLATENYMEALRKMRELKDEEERAKEQKDSYTENEESNEDKDKKNDVVVISDMTTKTTNL